MFKVDPASLPPTSDARKMTLKRGQALMNHRWKFAWLMMGMSMTVMVTLIIRRTTRPNSMTLSCTTAAFKLINIHDFDDDDDQAEFHDAYILHHSDENRSQKRRCAFIARSYMSEEEEKIIARSHMSEKILLLPSFIQLWSRLILI